MRGNYAVFGLGSFGARLAVELSQAKNNVVAVDIDKEKVDSIRDEVAEAIVADVSNEDVIHELDVKKFDAVILGMSSNFEDLVLTLTLLKQDGVKKVYAKAKSVIQERILYRLGADEIIQPEHDVAMRLCRRLTLDNIFDMFEFKGSAIAEVAVTDEISGKSLRQLDLRNRFHINVLLIRNPGGVEEDAWSPDTILNKGDFLTVFGSKKAIMDLFQKEV